MALLFSESFGAYSVVADLLSYGISDSASQATDSIDSVGGYNAAPAYKGLTSASSGSATLLFPYVFAPASNELRFGFWVKTSSGAVGDGNANSKGVLIFFDSTLVKWMGVRLSGTGKIGWTNLKGGVSSAIDYTGAISVNDGQHHWIEGRVVLGAASNGTVQTWVDGVQDINQTAVTNDGGLGLTCTSMVRLQLGYTFVANASSQWLSHVMVWDTSGTILNGYLGPARIEYLIPNAAGTNAQLTPTSGANYTTVNEQVQNFDTSYVEGATSGLIDTYNYGNLSSTALTVKAVAVKTFAKNADVGAKTFRAKCLSGATYGNGVDQTLSPAYKQFLEVYHTDPNTAAAWTAAGVNAAEFGVEVRP